jgi:competence protein ComFC
VLGEFVKTIVEILYPLTCITCKGKLKNRLSLENLVCVECWVKIKKNLPPFCYRCGRHLEKNSLTKNICPGCIKRPLHFDRAFSPCLYEGVLKELIREFKYKNKDYLGPILSKLMIEFIREYNLPMDTIDFIIPIPLHKTRLREREFNQAQILSNYIASEFNKEVMHDNLRRSRYTKTQTELEENERFLNVKDSFVLNRHRDIKGKNILLVDDVLTTAATSSEAAYILKNAGANIVFVLTLAN